MDKISADKTLQRLRRLIHNPTFQAVALAVAYIFFASSISLLHHYSYETYALDLGAFAQSLQSTLHGDILYNTPCGMSQLGYHFSPILFLLAPIFWLFPYCETLLIVQSIALGASGYLVYKLARIQQLSHRTALFVEVLFLLSPLVWGVNFFDFHAVAFAVPMLLIMLIGLVQKRWKLFALGLVLSLMTREDVIMALAVFGLVMLIAQYVKNKKLDKAYLAIFASSIAMFGIAVVVARAVSGMDVPPILMYGSLRYTYLNEPFGQMLLGALGTFFSGWSMLLLLAYFAPLGFLPLFSPLWAAPALLILAMGMFSTKAGLHELTQYSAPAIPFLFMALIITLTQIREKGRYPFLRKAWKFLPVAMIVVALSVSLPYTILRGATLPGSHAEAIDRVIALIPDGTTVSAPNHIFPHLCLRTTTYMPPWPTEADPNSLYGDFGVPDRETDYVVIDSQRKQPYPGGGWWEDAIADYLKERYDLLAQMDGVSLYKLKP
jgi:uncharacterized membrane protein